jgi:NitT/TauT family transport system substrate-binding protein
MVTRAAALAALTALASAPTAAFAQTAPSVKVGSGSVEANAQGFYAVEAGLFKKAGVDVDLTILKSGPAIAAAVIGGDLNVGVSNVISLASAKLRGIPLTLIAPGAIFDAKDATEQMVVLRDGPIRAAKDLNGRVVGGQSIGSTAQLALLAWIDKNGGDAASVKYVEIPPSATVEALEAGRIFAAAIQDPQLSAAGNRVRILGRAYESIAKTYMLTAWFATSDWVAKNPAVARRTADGLIAAGEWAMANPAAATAVFEKYTKVRLAHFGEVFGHVLDPALLQPIFDSATKYKLLPGTLAANDFIWPGR